MLDDSREGVPQGQQCPFEAQVTIGRQHQRAPVEQRLGAEGAPAIGNLGK
jgi:hypothetical protein